MAEEREALRDQWRRDGWYTGASVGEALAAGAVARPDDLFVFSTDSRESCLRRTQLHDQAVDLARRLYARGLRPGAHVIVQAPADAAGTTLLEALWLLGTVVVPLPTTAAASEVAYVLTETSAHDMIVAPQWRRVDLADQARRCGARRVTVLGDTLPDPVPLPPIAPDPRTVACVLYTSGSSGAPKGVRHSHETLLAGLGYVQAGPVSRSLMTFPAGHVASLLGLLRPLIAGGVTVVMDRWSAARAVDLISRYAVNSSAGTPFFLATLLDEADATGRDISTLTRFLVGAASVPDALVARSEAHGITTWRTYGSTEHPAICSGGPQDPPEKRRSTDGRPGPGNEVRIASPDGRDLPPGQEGEILARGPKQFLGYADPSLDDDAFRGTSWFHTGDLGRLSADGYLIVSGRLKDIIIRGGENISATEVENVLARHPQISEVAVCSAPDPLWGESVCAVAVPRPGGSLTLEELRRHATADGLPAHKQPTHLVIVDELPRTPAGKVSKRDLRRVVGQVADGVV